MAFGLAIGTERAAALQVGEEGSESKGVVLTRLQTSIQNELTRRGLSADGTPAFPSGFGREGLILCPDAVMAEYITIMIINNKTSGA